MSRSHKKPIIQSSHQIDKDKAHRQVRRRVKVELQKIEPDLCIIEADTKDLGLEEWGTKFDFRFDDWDFLDDVEKYSRK